MKKLIIMSTLLVMALGFFSFGKFNIASAKEREHRTPRPTVSPVVTPTPAPVVTPYQCGGDACQGYRCVVGNSVGRSCYNATDIQTVSCAGTFEFIPTFNSCSTTQYYWN